MLPEAIPLPASQRHQSDAAHRVTADKFPSELEKKRKKKADDARHCADGGANDRQRINDAVNSADHGKDYVVPCGGSDQSLLATLPIGVILSSVSSAKNFRTIIACCSLPLRT